MILAMASSRETSCPISCWDSSTTNIGHSIRLSDLIYLFFGTDISACSMPDLSVLSHSGRIDAEAILTIQ